MLHFICYTWWETKWESGIEFVSLVSSLSGTNDFSKPPCTEEDGNREILLQPWTSVNPTEFLFPKPTRQEGALQPYKIHHGFLILFIYLSLSILRYHPLQIWEGLWFNSSHNKNMKLYTVQNELSESRVVQGLSPRHFFLKNSRSQPRSLQQPKFDLEVDKLRPFCVIRISVNASYERRRESVCLRQCETIMNLFYSFWILFTGVRVRDKANKNEIPWQRSFQCRISTNEHAGELMGKSHY